MSLLGSLICISNLLYIEWKVLSSLLKQACLVNGNYIQLQIQRDSDASLIPFSQNIHPSVKSRLFCPQVFQNLATSQLNHSNPTLQDPSSQFLY